MYRRYIYEHYMFFKFRLFEPCYVAKEFMAKSLRSSVDIVLLLLSVAIRHNNTLV